MAVLAAVVVAVLVAVVVAGSCRGGTSDRAAGGPVTTAPSLDAALPSAPEIGGGYEEVPVTPPAGPCTFAISEPVVRARRSFVSDAAQERIDLQVLGYTDDRAASAAFAGARSASSCRPGASGAADGRPVPVTVDGAVTSFAISSTDPLDSIAITVALVGPNVVVAGSTLHQGATTAAPRGAQAVATQAAARLP